MKITKENIPLILITLVVLLVHTVHTNFMKVKINLESPTPIFNQLIQQIKHAVDQGNIRPEDPLPSIRQLANDLELNHNTVAKAYKFLERDAIIQTQGYRGTIIHPNAKINSKHDLNDTITSSLTKSIQSLRDAGATDSEIRIAFNAILKNS